LQAATQSKSEAVAGYWWPLDTCRTNRMQAAIVAIIRMAEANEAMDASIV
jgi:hypothetical protein